VGAEACREAEEESNARQGVRTSKKKEVAGSLTRNIGGGRRAIVVVGEILRASIRAANCAAFHGPCA
jgi:hypothetical protein